MERLLEDRETDRGENTRKGNSGQSTEGIADGGGREKEDPLELAVRVALADRVAVVAEPVAESAVPRSRVGHVAARLGRPVEEMGVAFEGEVLDGVVAERGRSVTGRGPVGGVDGPGASSGERVVRLGRSRKVERERVERAVQVVVHFAADEGCSRRVAVQTPGDEITAARRGEPVFDPNDPAIVDDGRRHRDLFVVVRDDVDGVVVVAVPAHHARADRQTLDVPLGRHPVGDRGRSADQDTSGDVFESDFLPVVSLALTDQLVAFADDLDLVRVAARTACVPVLLARGGRGVFRGRERGRRASCGEQRKGDVCMKGNICKSGRRSKSRGRWRSRPGRDGPRLVRLCG